MYVCAGMCVCVYIMYMTVCMYVWTVYMYNCMCVYVCSLSMVCMYIYNACCDCVLWYDIVIDMFVCVYVQNIIYLYFQDGTCRKNGSRNWCWVSYLKVILVLFS